MDSLLGENIKENMYNNSLFFKNKSLPILCYNTSFTSTIFRNQKFSSILFNKIKWLHSQQFRETTPLTKVRTTSHKQKC